MPRDKTPAPSPSSTKKVATSSKNGLAKPKVAAALKTKVNPAAASAQGTSSPAAEPKLAPTIGDYLIRRLLDYGMKDIFGIPGDFVLQFYGDLEASPIRVIGCTREDNAGYAADGYARIHGIGGVCVTYCVGGLSVCNSVAGAFAEKSPVVVITGSPGVEERRSNPLLHHRVREFSTQREVFEKITIASTVLDDALTACREIDRCLEACVRFKRPVYIELPRDMIKVRCPYEHVPHTQVVKSDKFALKEALVEAGEMLAKAERPIILAGVEMHRFGLADELIHFAEKFEIPISATLLGKSVISEKHPLFIGIYEGAMCRESVRKYVEQSDCIVMLGTYMTDIDMGIFTAELDTSKTIYVTSETLKISHHHFHDILVSDFVKGLSKLDVKIKQRELPKKPKPVPKFVAVPETAVTSARLFARINELLDEKMVVVADVGDCLFGAADLTIYRDTEFLSPAYYTSMGFAIPAALGVQVARKDLRPIVLVGDGAFQMTCLELSTILRHNFNPIVIVLNNKGYTTERFIQDGPFNDILNWNYHRLPDLFGGGWGFEIRTEGELDQALHAAVNNKETFCLLNVHLDPFDVSPALKRLGERLAQHM